MTVFKPRFLDHLIKNSNLDLFFQNEAIKKELLNSPALKMGVDLFQNTKDIIFLALLCSRLSVLKKINLSLWNEYSDLVFILKSLREAEQAYQDKIETIENLDQWEDCYKENYSKKRKSKFK